MQDFRLTAFLGACLIVLPTFTDAFWRLPCRGRTGVARLDPIVEPGEISGHIHAVHGAGNFGMSSDMNTLLDSSCTSCAVEQDMSAYWTPPLYFMHTNGSAELVPQIGGMLVYYLLYGENVTAFPSNFRLLAGDPYQRNFTWPIPDPPKSSWSGAQLSQEALRQKAIGFNCLNYAMAPEPSLYRHFLPNKTYLDEHCTDGVRLELMFPSCWNGEDVDSTDHKSHMAYPTLVIDGTCPEGYETRLVSLFFETIWDTYVFKDVDGYFTLSNGDPTGFGYHGDFMYGWEDGVLQEAVDTCTSDTGLVEDCAIFNLQSESNQRECFFDVPESLKDENVYMHANGLPGAMAIESGPAYATMSMASSPSSSTTSLEPSTTSKEPSTTSKEPSTTSKEPSTTSQEPGTTSKEPSTTSQEPGTTLKEPGTALQEPGTSTPYISISLPPLSISIGDLNLDAYVTHEPATIAPSSTTSTFTHTPTPTTVELESIIEEIVYLGQNVYVLTDENGTPYATKTGAQRTLTSLTTTIMAKSTVVSYVERDNVPEESEKQEHIAEHARRHVHHHGHMHKRF